jgi:hypothetical protein
MKRRITYAKERAELHRKRPMRPQRLLNRFCVVTNKRLLLILKVKLKMDNAF